MLDPSLKRWCERVRWFVADRRDARTYVRTHELPCRTEARMSNLSSIGVSVYEITHDCRVAWLFRFWPAAPGTHWAHEGLQAAPITGAELAAGNARRAAAADDVGPGRLRASPQVRALAVGAYRPRLPGRHQVPARARRPPGRRRAPGPHPGRTAKL